MTSACAAAGWHLEVLQWARQRDGPWNQETCASGGGVDIGEQPRVVRLMLWMSGRLDVWGAVISHYQTSEG